MEIKKLVTIHCLAYSASITVCTFGRLGLTCEALFDCDSSGVHVATERETAVEGRVAR